MAKFLDYNGLMLFWNKIKTYIDSKIAVIDGNVSSIYEVNNTDVTLVADFDKIVSSTTQSTLFDNDFIEGCLAGVYRYVKFNNYQGKVILPVSLVTITDNESAPDIPDVTVCLRYIEYPSWASINNPKVVGNTQYPTAERTIVLHVSRVNGKIYTNYSATYITQVKTGTVIDQ